jgi:predicted RND superfamily exporter protein
MISVNRQTRICIILAGMLFIMTGLTLAQHGEQPPSPPSANDIMTKMKQELKLSDEQVSQITPIIKNEIEQMQALMSQGTDRDAGRSQMEALRKSTESKLSQYLTQEQITLWKNKQNQEQK